MKATVAEKWWHDSDLSALSYGDPKGPEIGAGQFQMSKSTTLLSSQQKHCR